MSIRGRGRLRAFVASASEVAGPAIAFIDHAVGTNSVTLPGHIAGDLFYGFAFRDGGIVTASPAGWTSLGSSTEASAGGSWVREFLAIDGATANPTFTSATSCAVVQMRNVKAPPDDLGGDSTFTFAKSTDFTNTSAVYKDPGFTVTDGTSAMLAMVCSSDPGFTATPPAGMTLIATASDATSKLCVFLGLNFSSFTQETIALGVTAGWVTATAEICKASGTDPFFLLTEGGDRVLTESGGGINLEQ